jgi:hypothetical protein
MFVLAPASLFRARGQGRARATGLTVDSTLELLPADLAVEPAAAGLLVELDFDRLFVVAEEACECRREAFALGKGRPS